MKDDSAEVRVHALRLLSERKYLSREQFDLVAKATPDGYTLLMGNVGPIAINVSLYRKLPYDPLTDLAPVTLMAIYPNVLVVHPGIAAKSVGELVALARARPGQLSYASAGTWGSSHMCMEALSALTGISMVHVPYKSSPQALTDIVAGRIHTYCPAAPGLPTFAT